MKRILIKILNFINLYNIAKKIENRYYLLIGKGHGHSLLLFLLKKKDFFRQSDLNFIEIGASREEIFGQGSTKIIANYCEKYKIKFTSVDADGENVKNIKNDLREFKYFKIINDTGENFSKNYKEKIDVMYLDAFDIETKNPPQKRVQFYKEKFNKNISNYESAKMHFEVINNFLDNFNKKCLIVFDDTFKTKEDFSGKGKTAIPLLLKNNFKIIKKNENSIALERK